MAKKGKLLSALDAHKGRDFKLEHQKKLQKNAEKRKRSKLDESGAEEEDNSGSEEEAVQKDTNGGVKLVRLLFTPST